MAVTWLMDGQRAGATAVNPFRDTPTLISVNPGAPKGNEVNNDVQVWKASRIILTHPGALLVCSLPKKLIQL